MEILLYTENVQKSQFILEMTSQEHGAVIDVNGSEMMKAHYNLLVSIRDCGLYAKGMKPNKFWKITEVKKYFGLKGNAEKIYNQLSRLRDEMNALAEMELEQENK